MLLKKLTEFYIIEALYKNADDHLVYVCKLHIRIKVREHSECKVCRCVCHELASRDTVASALEMCWLTRSLEPLVFEVKLGLNSAGLATSHPTQTRINRWLVLTAKIIFGVTSNFSFFPLCYQY